MKNDAFLIIFLGAIALFLLSGYYSGLTENLEIQKIKRMEYVKEVKQSCDDLAELMKRYKTETKNKFTPIFELCEITTKELENEVLDR